MTIPTKDFILYLRDGKTDLSREEHTLHENEDGETLRTIAQDLYRLEDDGLTVQVILLDRSQPSLSKDVTSEIVDRMQQCFTIELDRDRPVHPLIADFAAAEILAEDIQIERDRRAA